MIKYSNRRIKTVFGIIVVMLFITSSFVLLPADYELYLTTDIASLRQSLLLISILLSISITFLFVFNKTQFNKGKWSKVIHIGYIYLFGFGFSYFTSNILTTITLQVNRLTTAKTFAKTFLASTIETTNNEGVTDSKLWVVMHDEIYEVRGRILHKSYDDNVDGLFMNYDDFMKIADKKEFEITLEEGVFGIPFNPKVIE